MQSILSGMGGRVKREEVRRRAGPTLLMANAREVPGPRLSLSLASPWLALPYVWQEQGWAGFVKP